MRAFRPMIRIKASPCFHRYAHPLAANVAAERLPNGSGRRVARVSPEWLWSKAPFVAQVSPERLPTGSGRWFQPRPPRVSLVDLVGGPSPLTSCFVLMPKCFLSVS